MSPCAWVKLIFSISRIVRIFAQGPCFLQRSNFQQLDLCSVIVWSGSHEFFTGKKKNLCVSSLCKPYFRIVQGQNWPCQILTVILVQGPCTRISQRANHLCTQAVQQCPEDETLDILAHPRHATVSSGRSRRHAQSEVRTMRTNIGRSTSDKAHVNTKSGLSGGKTWR